jgi:hypothetical protein
MSVNVQFVHVHTLDATRVIVADALAIADEQGFEGPEWRAVFEQACALLGARVMLQAMPQSTPIDLSALKLTAGR